MGEILSRDRFARLSMAAGGTQVAPLSALMRSNHQFQSRFDPPPTFGILAFSLLFKGAGLLGRLGNSLGAMGFKQLSGVILNV
jgi:hypothetical protein